ncbi:MAG: hypothetical protein IPH51_23705 [Rubrivivax sp.]|nr:hypothetical protein [Rubrivivax sp.]
MDGKKQQAVAGGRNLTEVHKQGFRLVTSITLQRSSCAFLGVEPLGLRRAGCPQRIAQRAVGAITLRPVAQAIEACAASMALKQRPVPATATQFCVDGSKR